ncbi:hypothetical protein HNY73_022140 [Argiope bruennichi]|uniref:H15 domain-containing protein n=1 Tax=Argiope bruennichi TaxID=94029 RepID=A0A8T0E1M4_ARGBR|nr:hypothetical protein HNY73_022140 [Argiope bruennichi]
MTTTTAEKAKIRKWILTAVTNSKDSKGVTTQHIKKFLDSKQDGLSSKPVIMLVLKRLLETGHLVKKDGKYVIKKSKRKIPGKDMKRSKSPARFAGQSAKKQKSATKSPNKLQKPMNEDNS